MQLYSTRNRQNQATWRDAVLSGIAPDGGLYLPLEIPLCTEEEIDSLRGLSFPDLATHLAHRMIGTAVPRPILEDICLSAFNFPLHLKQLDEQLYVFELFHGPTCAFKDFGARFMARLFRYFWGERQEQLTVVVATSGDTGGAVADAFLDTSSNPSIRVAILYPKNKVSDVQRKQMTTLGHNVTAYQVDGSFDDCQALAKQALCDTQLLARTPLTSANSINIARLLPQMFYYAYASLQFPTNTPPLFSIPSGNLGNLTGALLAHILGFTCSHVVAACNANKTFPEFLTTGSFSPLPSIETISNAMDVGNPSNFYRIVELLKQHSDSVTIQTLLSASSITDEETRLGMQSLYSSHQYILDPHTAVALCALQNYRQLRGDDPGPQVLVATAHPAKFSDTVKESLGFHPAVPDSLQSMATKHEQYTEIGNSYAEFQSALSNRY